MFFCFFAYSKVWLTFGNILIATEGLKRGLFKLYQVFPAISPYVYLLCLVVLSLSGYSASYLQYCRVTDRIKTKRWWRSQGKSKLCVGPCVEIAGSCLSTPSHFLFALNDQRRSTRDLCADENIWDRPTQTDHRRFHSERCPCVCDIMYMHVY